MGLVARSADVGGAVEERPPFRPSPQQADFLDDLVEGDRHILLAARAGSGKSTTCRQGSHALGPRRRSVYCCFNSHVAREFQAGLPPNCRAATMHSLGLQMLRDAAGGKTVSVDLEKVDRLVEKRFPRQWDRQPQWATRKLASLCKNLLLDGEDPGELEDLAAAYEVDLPTGRLDEVLEAVPAVLKECLETPALVDFDDMIWLPVKLGLRSAARTDVLFIDEAQDLNAAQHAMMPGLCPSGRIVVVGDQYQAIYAFRGADAHSLMKLQASLGGSERGLSVRPLTYTRRCPKRVVALARRLVPDLEALDDAPDGEVVEERPEKWFEAVGVGDMVLCRTNAPLVSACYQLLKSGVPAVIRGRDIGKGLTVLVRRLKPLTVGDLFRAVGDYRAKELDKLSRLRNPASAVQALEDKCDCLLAICDGASTVQEVLGRIERMFSDVSDGNVVTLSSIHRAKGLERDRVVVLRPDLLPGPWAKTLEDQAQERNILYVGVTRARSRLTFCGPTPALIA
ncbi:UvrD-helicase domain-containing protein [Paludisphaera mucosa]|uniref:DNA 3'-5' helicase n=1 Tax=Paludisphaera mucosa TaxID=3030827 RepID=A0ABT6F6X2_9BACT|nr:UvrD-helicase domain-containing protein [Paludisphaera mucosa]MDG3003272.1 UvrD-helicase domain-containing protein [Paludisphaera mucosa]